MRRARGGKSRRGKDRWLLSVTTGYDDAGNQERHYETFRGTSRQADDRLDELLEHFDKIPARKRITLKEFAEKHYLPYVTERRRQLTVQGYTSKLKTHIYPRLGSKQLAEITPYDVDAWLSHLASKKVSEHTRLHAYRVLNQVMNQAVRWEFIERNRCCFVEAPQRPARDVTLPTMEEAQAILTAFVGHPIEPAVVLGMCGLRRSEACGMDWAAVDLKAGTVEVRKGRHRVKGGLKEERPKTPKSERTVDIPPWAVEALKRHRKVGGPVLQQSDGAPMDPDDVTRAYKERMTEAKLPFVRLKDLRHTVATLALEAGAELWQVAEHLGHSTTRTTEAFYIHTHSGASAAVSKRLEKLGG